MHSQMRNFSDIVAQQSDDEDEELSDGIPRDVDDEVLRTRHTVTRNDVLLLFYRYDTPKRKNQRELLH